MHGPPSRVHCSLFCSDSKYSNSLLVQWPTTRMWMVSTSDCSGALNRGKERGGGEKKGCQMGKEQQRSGCQILQITGGNHQNLVTRCHSHLEMVKGCHSNEAMCGMLMKM